MPLKSNSLSDTDIIKILKSQVENYKKSMQQAHCAISKKLTQQNQKEALTVTLNTYLLHSLLCRLSFILLY